MIRRTLVAAALATTALVALPTGPAQAGAQGYRCQAGYLCNTTYYSDSARTRLVGAKTEHCNGEVATWGTVTGYSNWSATPCP